MRRVWAPVSVVAVLAVLLVGQLTAAAQDATPGAEPGSLLRAFGYPELRVMITEGGIQAPDEVQGGPLLLVLENNLDAEAGFSIIQPPAGMAVADFLAILGPPPGAEAGAASPEAGATPPAAEPEGPPPPAFFEATWTGGAFAPPGGESAVIISLTPGEWILAGPPEAGIAPVMLTVSGAEGATPAASPGAGAGTVNARVEFYDEDGTFQFRLPERVEAGPQVWETTNTGTQPHEMFILRAPRPLTVDEVRQLLELPPDAPPPPGLPGVEEFIPLGGVAPISQDQTVLAEFAFEPGTYVAVCFMPDRETGMPHAAKGMYTVFTVGAAGEDVPPPASPVASPVAAEGVHH